MSGLPELTVEQRNVINQGYEKFFEKPFETKYEEKFVEIEFWAAVENYKKYAAELGFKADPIEYMKKIGSFKTYEAMRDYLKRGPPAYLRDSWVSEFVGTTVDVKELIERCEHVGGPKFSGEEGVVVLDFWDTHCHPCMVSAPVISDLADRHAGKVAFIGINIDAIAGPDMPSKIEKIKTFVEAKKEIMRFTVVLDSVNHAENEFFDKAGFDAVPCMIVIVDNKVTFVGDYQTDDFQRALVVGIETTSGHKYHKLL